MKVVIDTSALICIFLREPEADEMLRVIAADNACVIAAPTWCEAAMVLHARLGENASLLLGEFMEKAHIQTVEFTPEMAQLAYQAWCEYGKGRHPASLNYGDCFAYALAKHENAALLYKGQDFLKTDIPPALN